ncbi:hypothetical protein ACFOYU_19080 [Microvirga sp. GCM10011540]|uniref:hypothetical protein n=1 Tax=Microvirga sp. GCM10011540 TaxID=3317338 RepID=UPI00361C39A5
MRQAIFDDWDEDDAPDDWDERSHRRVRRPLPWLRTILLSGLSIGVLVYLAQNQEKTEAPRPIGAIPASVLIAPPPQWRPISASPPLYGIDQDTLPLRVQAREHVSGGREDTLVLGGFGEAGHGRISVVQGFTEPSRSFFVDIVRRAAEAGLSVTRDAQSRLVPTKFGPVEAAAVTLAGASEQECQAFRFADPEANFAFQGWLCGGGEQAVEEAQLACLIDKVSLLRTDDPSLKAIFARAEAQRAQTCGPGARTASLGVRNPGRP